MCRYEISNRSHVLARLGIRIFVYNFCNFATTQMVLFHRSTSDLRAYYSRIQDFLDLSRDRTSGGAVIQTANGIEAGPSQKCYCKHGCIAKRLCLLVQPMSSLEADAVKHCRTVTKPSKKEAPGSK